jgi:predicted CoA-binding protein
MRYRAEDPAWCRSMARLRAAWVTQAVVGCAVAPRTRMRRVACSMTARTYRLVPVSVTVSMKSAASSVWACQRSKVAQVVVVRSGEGSMPASRRICQTVEAATLIPRVSSSPCTELEV